MAWLAPATAAVPAKAAWLEPLLQRLTGLLSRLSGWSTLAQAQAIRSDLAPVL